MYGLPVAVCLWIWPVASSPYSSTRARAPPSCQLVAHVTVGDASSALQFEGVRGSVHPGTFCIGFVDCRLRQRLHPSRSGDNEVDSLESPEAPDSTLGVLSTPGTTREHAAETWSRLRRSIVPADRKNPRSTDSSWTSSTSSSKSTRSSSNRAVASGPPARHGGSPSIVACATPASRVSSANAAARSSWSPSAAKPLLLPQLPCQAARELDRLARAPLCRPAPPVRLHRAQTPMTLLPA